MAEYVASMPAELAAMARGSKLDFVAHLLDMARLAAVEGGGAGATPADHGAPWLTAIRSRR